MSIAYPRRQALPDLPEQAELKAIYTKTDYINKDDAPAYYYLGIPCQTRTYEVTGVNWSSGEAILTADIFTAILSPVLIPGDFRPYEWQRPGSHIGLEKRIIEWSRLYFRTDASADVLDITLNAMHQPTRTLNNRLSLGEIARLALPYESLTAAFTDDIVTQNFTNPANVSPEMLLEGGYHREPDIQGYWWVPGGQQSFDQLVFYQANTIRNPFAVDSHIMYDDYALITIETIDALGNKIKAEIDYRVLQAGQVTDPNGNYSFAAFDALGLVVGTAVQSKNGDGDTLQVFVTDLSDRQMQEYLGNPLTYGAALLAQATSRMIYDLWSYKRGEDRLPGSIHPPVVATLSREIHDSALKGGETSPIQHSFLYSDGFGRTVQTKVQAEPESATPNVLRWVGTGTIIYNNKGKPVKQYEPFFSNTHAYGIEQHGVSPTLFYDPLERTVCTLHPNHTYEKVVFDPWQQATWDVNDTVILADPKDDLHVGEFFRRLPDIDYLPTWYEGRKGGQLGAAEQSAATKVVAHANTPAIAHLDTLGRTTLTIADNGAEGQYKTSVELDIEGKQLAVIDARDRIVMQYAYDIAGNVLWQISMEAGTRWMLNNVAGKPMYGWNSRGYRLRYTYDELQRPMGLFVSKNGNPEALAEKTVYGESQSNPEQFNLRGKVYQVFDGAGVVTSLAYDFKGNLLKSHRQLLKDYVNQADWTRSPMLESGLFTGSSRYDAMNRPIQIIAPHGDQGSNNINVIQPTYNEANLLERVDVWLGQGAEPQALLDPLTANLHAVENIDYNARGQRTRIEYGNKTFTEYEYDTDTFRLTNLLTIRTTDNRQLQNLSYTYDPAGNITAIRDDAQQTIYFNNTVVEPSNDYIYDAIYRLIEAKGREHVGQQSKPETTWNDEFRTNLEHPHDGQKMRRYTEIYEYDEVGNIKNMIHTANSNGNWTRTYTYNEPSLIESGKTNNRLTSTTIGATTETYSTGGNGYDAHGNMLRMPHLPVMVWDFKDQLHVTERQVVNNGNTAERTYYVYDATGQRVRKVTERQNGTRKNERIYLGGFEIYREYNGNGSTVTLERETLHVMDDKQRIALVETLTQGNDGSPPQLIRYQYSNHLGSASLELDDQAQIISYEEYYPYGSTAYQAVDQNIEAAAKRYRYTGKERDEESGLYYHGARYYASWLGRWMSCDPVPYENLYSYAALNPITRTDPNGRQPVNPTSGPYRTVRGDHVHQVASRTAGPGAKRTSASEFWGAHSINTKSPGYNDAGGQRVETAINRAQWGKDINGTPAKTGRVTINATGQTNVGTTRAAQQSPWFEDVKSFYKLREAGLSPDDALREVSQSADQLERAGATPERVPNAPRSTPKALTAAQTLSQQDPTRISGQSNLESIPPEAAPAPKPVAEPSLATTPSPKVAEPSPSPAPRVPTANQPTKGVLLRAAAGKLGKVLGAVGVAVAVKDIYTSVKKGEYGHAAVTTGATALSFTPVAPLVLGGGVIAKYYTDPTVEQRAFSAGDWVQEHTGSSIAGGLASAGTAVGLSVYEVGADFVHGVRGLFTDW